MIENANRNCKYKSVLIQNHIMQKSRPLGITILAIWALAASGLSFVEAVRLHLMVEYWQSEFNPVEYWETMDLMSAISSLGSYVISPLGSGIIGTLDIFASETHATAFISYFVLLGALYALIGLLTLKLRRSAWLANVGISIVAAVALPISVLNFYSSAMDNLDVLSESFVDIRLFFIFWSLTYFAYAAAIAFRLYYLFRPNVRDVFGTTSMFEQKRTV